MKKIDSKSLSQAIISDWEREKPTAEMERTAAQAGLGLKIAMEKFAVQIVYSVL
ncbi:MAG: hypothetical protein Q4D52_01950 [Eubacteriales bacterium]|nr:hypothetical protein [Eubacteriales bacterium]